MKYITATLVYIHLCAETYVYR